MAGAKLIATRYPGIYRRGERFLYVWTDAAGKRRKATTDTLEKARTGKSDREREAREGVPTPATPGRVTLARYARQLYGADLTREKDTEPLRGRYRGRRTAVRASTLREYRTAVERMWLPALGARPLESITAGDLRRVIDKMAAQEAPHRLADATIRRYFAPMSALLATASEEDIIPVNVARDVRLPSGRDQLHRFATGTDDTDEDDARALTGEQVATFLTIVGPRWRTFFALLATTGLRYSEATALRWADLHLDGSTPHLRVRRSVVHGVYGPPKTSHARRKVPLPPDLVTELRDRHRLTEWPGEADLVFGSQSGTPLAIKNTARRVLRPAAQEAGVPWIGFHTFRHSCASMLVADGRNILQVSRWLGHHDAGFTLRTYAHLLDEGVGEALATPEGGRWGDVAPDESATSSRDTLD